MSKKKKVASKLRKRFAELGDFPKEVVTDCSRMVLMGASEFTVENYSGIIEYETGKIRVNSASGVITVLGENLSINELDNDELYVMGKIKSIEIEGDE